MLTLVFVFMLLNLTSIWKLPTLSIGGHGRDGVLRIVGPGARFFVRGRGRKVALGPSLSGGSHQRRFRPLLNRTVP